MLTWTREPASTASKIFTVVVLAFAALYCLAALNHTGTVRLTDCYAHVMETHDDMSAAGMADALRAYGRCS